MNDWKPIETYDLGQRVPILVHDPDWYDSQCPTANVAHGYWDEQLGWQISLFESASSYAWVNYYSKDFKPKYWMPCPKPPTE